MYTCKILLLWFSSQTYLNSWLNTVDYSRYTHLECLLECNIEFSSIYRLLTQSQRGCLLCPHISQLVLVNHSCQCSGGSDSPRPGCGCSGCHCLLSESFPDCLQWCSILVLEGGPVYLKRSLPAALTTTTAQAEKSATQMSKLLFSRINRLTLVIPLNSLFLFEPE